MTRTERIHQKLTEGLNQDEIRKFESQGWRPVAVDWERDLPAGQSESELHEVTKPPFGLQVAKNCSTLEENPSETTILLEMMELIIQDGPYSEIAQVLNRKGYRTREGIDWTAVSVFEMLPRLIESGPKIFAAAEWTRRKQETRTQKLMVTPRTE